MNSIFKNQINVRESIKFDKIKFVKDNASKVILITGAGTIGSEILKELYDTEITIIVLDNSEFTLFKLKEQYKRFKNIHFILCSIRDSRRVNYIFEIYKPSIIVHTAAYKHVEFSENNIYEAIRTNIEGTINVFNSSLSINVEQFVFITTDKAVYPKSIMGKTKRIAELYLESFIDKTEIDLKILRFGNVINSSGSLISIINTNIDKNLPIVVRGKDTKRFFIFPEVVSKSILNLLSINQNGFYLIDMDKSIRILDLVEEMLINNNLDVSNITLKELVEGEKENEDLLYEDEKLTKTEYKELFMINKNKRDYSRKNIVKLIKHNKKNKHRKVEYFLNKIIFESQL